MSLKVVSDGLDASLQVASPMSANGRRHADGYETMYEEARFIYRPAKNRAVLWYAKFDRWSGKKEREQMFALRVFPLTSIRQLE